MDLELIREGQPTGKTIGAGGFEPPTPCMSSKYSTPELRACKSIIWMWMIRHFKACRHFVKDGISIAKRQKTLKKQHVELFCGKSQYELLMKVDKYVERGED